MTAITAKKSAMLKYVRDFAIAIVICALIAVTIDYVCFLWIGETSAGTWYDKYWMGFFFCCLFVVSSFVILRDKLADNPEYLYLIIVLTVGIYMAWSLSVLMVGWDTEIHFRHVLGWADIDDQFELSYSEATYVLTHLTQNSGVEDEFSLKGLYDIESWLNANNDSIVDIRQAYSFWKVLPAIEYIPCAIVMFFCELFDLPFTASHFLALMPCILIYSFVTFAGMRKLKSGKMLFAVIALFPSSLFLAANYGYQYWNISLFLYAFACLASFIQRKQVVRYREIVFMMVAFILACLPRMSYAPLVLLALLTPRACFKSVRASRLFRGVLIGLSLATAISFAYITLSSGLGSGDERGGSRIDPDAQISLIISDPIGYLQKLIAFFAPPYVISPETKDYVSGYLSISGSERMIGLLGYLGIIPFPLFIIVLILLTTTTITDKRNDERYGIAPALFCILVCFIDIILTTTYMYVTYNNVGEDAFRGVQARYLLPFMFPSLAFLGKGKWGLNGSAVPSSIYNCIVLAAMSATVMLSWWFIYVVQIY